MKIVIAGAGEVGFHLIERLHRQGVTLSVIDTNLDILLELKKTFELQVDQSNIVDSRFLRKNHLKDVDLFLAITNSDETNMIACKMAKSAGVSTTVCRIRSIQLKGNKKQASLESLGIDHIINPVELVADELLQMVMLPNLIDLHLLDQGRLSFLGYQVQPYNFLLGMDLQAIQEKLAPLGARLALLSRQERCFLPSNQHQLEDSDHVYIFCPTEQHPRLRKLMGYAQASATRKRVMINGGGHIGFQLAKRLEATPHHVKLIEPNAEQAQQIAGKLTKAMVLQFDGTELKKLNAEGVDEQDFFISVTSREEVNLAACLMAKQNSRARAVCLVKQQELIPIVERATAIERAISPRLTTSKSLDQFLGEGRVESSFYQRSMQVLQLRLTPSSPWIGKSVADLELGDASALGLLARGNRYLAPRPELVFEEDDLLLLLVHRLDKTVIFDKFGLAV